MLHQNPAVQLFQSRQVYGRHNQPVQHCLVKDRASTSALNSLSIRPKSPESFLTASLVPSANIAL
ncbi:hypothetical protein QQP08_019616 [Theobroma cacao]|nr:hypothetical protein QQP08_019616 [Theobroma cacao]